MKTLRQHIYEMDQLVCELTGMDMEELSAHKFEMAYEYLDKVIGTDRHGLKEIPETELFWGHWTMVWYRLDQQIMEGDHLRPPVIRYDVLLQEYYYTDAEYKEYRCRDISHVREIYLDYHSAHGMMLNRSVIDAGWHQYIKSLNKIKS